MTLDRRDFVKRTGLGLAAAGVMGPASSLAAAEPTADGRPCEDLPRRGPKPVIRSERAMCSSSHPIVTDTMLDVMRAGGNAVDAAVAGSLVQATVEPHMTNHSGTVTMLYWEAKTERAYQLDSQGTLVPDLAPFRPVPAEVGGSFAAGRPMACIPGFVPGLGAMHARFGTRPWSSLCELAVRWAEEGHTVHSFEYALLESQAGFYTYFPESRAVFNPDGFTPHVGERFRNPELAATLRALAGEGPDHFTRGGWARAFVEAANRLGWGVSLEDMVANPPRWLEPLRYRHGDHEILQLAPPQRTGVFSALVLGVIAELGVSRSGHYTRSPESLYYLAHALRWADREVGLLYDPEIFHVPLEVWTSREYHSRVAEVLRRSRPKVDLSEHVRMTGGRAALAAAGAPVDSEADRSMEGSCELAIVDPEGNWVQMMNTLQTGGVPGMVVGGVPMVGSHTALNSMRASSAGWLVPGSRLRRALGNTIVLRDGRPWLSLGTPGNVHITVPQVLANVLEFGMDPYEASVAPRMLALGDDYVLRMEARVPPEVVTGIAAMGVRVHPFPEYHYPMGSYQMCWRDPDTGMLNGSTDPRRAGQAGGF